MPSRSHPTPLRTLILSASLLLAASAAHAQLAHRGPAAAIALSKTLAPYDVSTVKENKSAEGSGGIKFGDSTFTATNVTLQFVLQLVYDVKANQITGLTGPVSSQHFDINAKVLPSPTASSPRALASSCWP